MWTVCHNYMHHDRVCVYVCTHVNTMSLSQTIRTLYPLLYVKTLLHSLTLFLCKLMQKTRLAYSHVTCTHREREREGMGDREKPQLKRTAFVIKHGNVYTSTHKLCTCTHTCTYPPMYTCILEILLHKV